MSSHARGAPCRKDPLIDNKFVSRPKPKSSCFQPRLTASCYIYEPLFQALRLLSWAFG